MEVLTASKHVIPQEQHLNWDKCRISAGNYAITGVLLFGGLPLLEAQVGPYTPPAPGMWYSVGLGYSSMDCRNGCRLGAPAVHVGAGRVVSRKLHLGVMLSGLTRADDYLRVTVGSADFRARYYPDPTGGFYLTGGLGLGMIRLSAGRETTGDPTTQLGPTFLGGLGCDFQVTPHASVTLSADGSEVRGAGEDRLSLDVWKLGLGFMLH